MANIMQLRVRQTESSAMGAARAPNRSESNGAVRLQSVEVPWALCRLAKEITAKDAFLTLAGAVC